MLELLARFAIGGLVVSLFATLGDVFRPKSFAGLFGAAPSIALATVGMTIASNGKQYAAIEARSMMLGALAFFLYAAVVSWALLRFKGSTLKTTLALMPLWLVMSVGVWMLATQVR
jgi:Protein of unknown function (DUF3147)